MSRTSLDRGVSASVAASADLSAEAELGGVSLMTSLDEATASCACGNLFPKRLLSGVFILLFPTGEFMPLS